MNSCATDRDKRPSSDWAWRWAALLLGGVVLGLGCSPTNIGWFLLPFAPDTPPKFALTAKDKKQKSKVVVLVSFAGAPEVTPELLTADQELSDQFVSLLAKRFRERREKVELVPPHLVKAYQNKEEWRILSPAEIGQHFQADKVISLEINSMTLHERNSPMIFKGNVDITITACNCKSSEEGEVFRDQYLLEYPKVKIWAADSDGGAPYFRSRFIYRICEDLVEMFTQHGDEVGNHKVDE